MDILVACLWERAQNQSVVACHKADPLPMALLSSQENKAPWWHLIPNLIITTFTLSPPPMALKINPSHSLRQGIRNTAGVIYLLVMGFPHSDIQSVSFK